MAQFRPISPSMWRLRRISADRAGVADGPISYTEEKAGRRIREQSEICQDFRQIPHNGPLLQEVRYSALSPPCKWRFR